MILIVDSPYICHLYKHCLAGLNYEERQTGIIFGFMRQVLRLARDFETRKFVFAWDSKKSWRRDNLDKEYKMNRKQERTEEERQLDRLAYRQFAELRRYVLPKFGFRHIYIQTGRESDDLIASVVLNMEGPKTIVSTDNDLWQLLTRCDMWNPSAKKLYTEKAFREEWGLGPPDWAMVKALAGCPGDNVKGIPGVGEKTAAKFLRGELGKETKAWGRITAAMNQGTVKANIPLVRLPLHGTKQIALTDADFEKEEFRRDDFLTLCDEYGFHSFRRDLLPWLKAFKIN